jgi:tRNA(fMet)-specific endonuclease VapC
MIADLLVFIDVLNFDSDCAEAFGKLRGDLQRRGFVVPPIDLLVASVAVAHGLTLVTNNTSDFINIPGLRLVDWLTP